MAQSPPCHARQLSADFDAPLPGTDRTWFDTILGHAPDVALLLDVTGVVTSANRAAARVFGGEPGDLVGQSLSALCPDGYRAAVTRAVSTATGVHEKNGNPGYDHAEWLLPRSDGTSGWFDLRFSPVRPQTGGVSGVCVIGRDVTSRTQAERAAGQEIVRLSRAVAATADAPWEWHYTTGETHFSPRWYEMLGYDDRAFPMTVDTWRSLCHPDDIDRVLSQVRKAVVDDQSPGYEVEFRMRRREGGWAWILGRGSVVARTPDGEPLVLAGVNTDITGRKLAEEALRRSEERHRRLNHRYSVAVESADMGVWEYDLDTKTLVLDRRMYELYQLDPDQPVDMALWTSRVNPDDLPRVRETVAGVMNGGHPSEGKAFETEFRVVLPDGTVRHVRAFGRATRRSGGGSHQLIGINYDITARKQAEHDLRIQARVLDRMTEGVGLSDDHGMILYTNPAEDAIFGYDRGELIGRHASILIDAPPEDAERMAAEIIDRLRTDGSWSGEIPNRRKDGTPFTTFARLSTLDLNGRRHLVCVQADVTDRKRIEEERARLTDQLSTLLESMAEGVYGLDGGGRCTFVNRAGADLLGYRPEDLVGRNIHDLVHGRRSDGSAYPQAECPIHAVLRRGEPVRGTREVFWRRDATPVPIEFGASPILNGQDVCGAVVCFRDISERVRLEDELRQAQKLEAIGLLAGGVAHDFNNVLTVVKGYSELMLAARPPDHPEAPLVKAIYEATKRGAALTQQLLAFARKSMLKVEVVDPNVVINQLFQLLKRLLGEDVECVLRLTPDLARVRVDPNQLDQVIMNLAVNARDAMPRGGRLTLETSNLRLTGPAPAFPEAAPGEYVRLTVADTGTGMDPGTQARVFEPFFTTKEKGKGTGLGLSTVYGIVKQFDGHIAVQSRLGEGTEFCIVLPAVRETLSRPSGVRKPPARARAGELILLAEDDDAVRLMIIRILEHLGYRVIAVGSGAEAVTHVRATPDVIRLLLTDVVMPGMSGTELVAAVRAIRPDIKVLFVSGYTEDTVLRHGVSREAVAFLQKPFTPDSLAEHIRRVLDAD